ncbi:nicotinamide riboside transporter PnuC [Epilithonimonas ginsengisoli]|uniref:Nicotinamide riboside transporter PnuC n=1 Tax=Epilithonimonas ginsengisoli TaxID=1245592 RepID=A0ABU4JKZ6_9FLAO|nr:MULTISPECIES: nicotinamide riboside transporter PnuC [Chryseobacterium group]MBV6881374.1 nicotinamide riboside transporter PnuC [Epilithonimonas sp. FP105]MDW8550342.1 nicotinamide riboside transporter PnuC [Epilithonimonas ginsengisoli]OAH68307.1 nicotinamide mononucleotide transporter [Chryseobacterium sp. FP211-J200]
MDFLQTLTAQYSSYETYLIIFEVVAVFFGLLSVFFSIKQNIWVYPTGIISTVLFIYIMYVFGLLGDMLINVYYTVMSVYGWILWSKHSDDNIHVQVKTANKKDWQIGSVLFLGSLIFVGLVYYFKPYIDNQFSMNGVRLGLYHLDWANYTDIITTSLFLVGMFFMAKRNIENWIFWIVADFICIPMMVYKGLGITAIQYIIFTAMAIIGYLEWKKSLARN